MAALYFTNGETREEITADNVAEGRSLLPTPPTGVGKSHRFWWAGPGGDHPPVPPSTPVFDAFAYLCFLAGRTRTIRLGTHVYLLGLRHPFVAARAIQTTTTSKSPTSFMC